MGICYYSGNGITQDYVQAVNWWKKAANQGYAEAQYNLGICYDVGNGIAVDRSRTVYWDKKALNNNDGSLSEENKAQAIKRVEELKSK